MKPLVINKTERTPAISLNSENGIFSIIGRSLTEDTSKFYQPIIDWFEKYIQNPNPCTQLVFQLDYFNTSSSRIYMIIMKFLEKIYLLGYDASVEWCYAADDYDMLETGADYSMMVQVPFKFKIIGL
jgi:hypothetical protein